MLLTKPTDPTRSNPNSHVTMHNFDPGPSHSTVVLRVVSSRSRDRGLRCLSCAKHGPAALAFFIGLVAVGARRVHELGNFMEFSGRRVNIYGYVRARRCANRLSRSIAKCTTRVCARSSQLKLGPARQSGGIPFLEYLTSSVRHETRNSRATHRWLPPPV